MNRETIFSKNGIDLPRGCFLGDKTSPYLIDTHSDYSVSFYQISDYKIIGASAIGRLHIRDRKPRDDAYSIMSYGPWVAIALADGMGSKNLSRFGAAAAVNSLCHNVLRRIFHQEKDVSDRDYSNTSDIDISSKTAVHKESTCWNKLHVHDEKRLLFKPELFQLTRSDIPNSNVQPSYGTIYWNDNSLEDPKIIRTIDSRCINIETLIVNSFRDTRKDLEIYSTHNNISLDELHCTLLGLILNIESGELAAAQIGDGLIAYFGHNCGARELLSPIVPGDVGTTYVITQNNWQTYLTSTKISLKQLNDLSSIFMMSDGVADDCTYPPPEDIFQKWASGMTLELNKESDLNIASQKLLFWLANYEVPGSWDDRTLIAILRNHKQDKVIPDSLNTLNEK